MPARRADRGADRGRSVAADEGRLEDLDGLRARIGGVERGEDAVGQGVAERRGWRGRRRREDGGAHDGEVGEPRGVGGAEVVVVGRHPVGPAEQRALAARAASWWRR